jgi:hypothetical protein
MPLSKLSESTKSGFEGAYAEDAVLKPEAEPRIPIYCLETLSRGLSWHDAEAKSCFTPIRAILDLAHNLVQVHRFWVPPPAVL